MCSPALCRSVAICRRARQHERGGWQGGNAQVCPTAPHGAGGAVLGVMADRGWAQEDEAGRLARVEREKQQEEAFKENCKMLMAVTCRSEAECMSVLRKFHGDVQRATNFLFN